MVSTRIQCRRCFCHRGRLRALVLAAAAGSLFSYGHRSSMGGEPTNHREERLAGERYETSAAADVAAACAAAPPVTPAPGDELRHVVHYNVLNGVHDLARRHRLCEWLRAQHADVVTFNELNFWEQADLETFGQECGFRHALLLQTNSPYRVGAMSRADPITLVGKYLKGFGHGALHFATGGWHFVVTHLTPHGGKEGLAEARLLLENIDSSVSADTPLLILGDLNCLSPHDADRYNELHLASVLDKKKIATGKSKHGLAAKFLTENGKAVNYEIFQQFMAAGFADLRPATGSTPPWQLPPTAKPRSSTISGGSGEWPSQSVPTSLHDDAMHAAPMRLDYALANPAAQRRMGSLPENWHAGPVQTLFTDTLSDHFPLQVLMCEGGQASRDCGPKIRAHLQAREGMEARLDCDSRGWNKWRLRRVLATQSAARDAVAQRSALAMLARPSSATTTQTIAAGASPGTDMTERRIQTVIDWTDPLLWRPAPHSSTSESKPASASGDLEIGQRWEVVRVRGRPGASCSQVCLDEGRRRRGAGRLKQQSPQGHPPAPMFQATTATAAGGGDGLGASRQVPGGFELTPKAGRLRRDSRRLAQHYEHSTSLFGHPFNVTKIQELSQKEQAEHEQLQDADFAAEAAVAGAAIPDQAEDVGQDTAGQLDCLVHETHGICANGGKCIHLFGGGACACEEGFSGHHCDDVVDPEQEHSSQVHVGSETISAGDQRLADAISRVKAKDEDADRVLTAEVLSGARGAHAKQLLMVVTETPAGTMTHDLLTSLLRHGAKEGVEVDVLLLARNLAMQQLPSGAQQAIDHEPAQHVQTQIGGGDGGASRNQHRAPAVTDWDWQCSAKQIEVSNDCEQMTAEFGCANGCRVAPLGYPMAGDAAPCFSAWEGDMLPQVCIISGSVNSSDTAGASARLPHEKETEVAGCTYGAALAGRFLPGCVEGCKAFSTLEQSLAACSKQNTCGGVTKSTDQGHEGFQLRASTVPHDQPSDATSAQREISWVKKRCEGGAGGSSDLCGKRDLFGHAQRLCSCVAPSK